MNSTESYLFEQPISRERNGEYRIGIKCTNGIHAELTIYQANNGKYEIVFKCPAVIGKNGPGKQIEGDGKTPLGTWIIGEAYGILDNPGSNISYTKITNNMYWGCNSINGKQYNSLVFQNNSTCSLDEHLIDYPITYNYILDLGFNKEGIPYIGSAIFLHCWKNENTPTAGCVGVSEENMIKILQTITPNTSVTIY